MFKANWEAYVYWLEEMNHRERKVKEGTASLTETSESQAVSDTVTSFL